MQPPLKPPPEFFDQPEPDHPQPVTVHADGSVTGHLAPWDGCHTGSVNGAAGCVRAPKSATGYKMFHLGELELDDGSAIPVGRIVVGTDTFGHASLQASLTAAQDHYDKPGRVGAFVRAKDGKHGIWLSGVLRSGIDDTTLRDFRANLPSGDWRVLNGALELIGAVSVPVGGFPIPTHPMVASGVSGEVETLILPGLPPEDCEECVRDPAYVLEKRMIADSLADPYGDGLVAAAFSAQQRQRLAKTGAAMPDGSFPIRNCSDWMNARQAIGRAPASKRGAVRAHIAKRGRALGCSE